MTDAQKVSPSNTTASKQAGTFARSRWSHALVLADQLRQDMALKKNEQLRKYAFDLPPVDNRPTVVIKSVEAQADNVKSFENALLCAKTGNFTLDTLSEKFLDLKRTFNRMLQLNKADIQQVTLATSITKAALLMVLRTTESIVEVVTKGTKTFVTMNSLIAYIRSFHKQLPIHGRLLVDWYTVADTLDILLNDPDWLVQPRKAYWAMQVCDETLAWARDIFNENYRAKSVRRPVFDREDSTTGPEPSDS